MIITCPNCNKQFKIDNSLIPDEGRDLQCGSCNHVWFYKIEEDNNEALKLNEEIISKNIENNILTEILNDLLAKKFIELEIEKLGININDESLLNVKITT